jgi:NitT/TauT family transport system ATP-binding protein/nitrate/nitrite transport system substrate-binding protein
VSTIRIGVLRLVDSAPVLVAAERGLFAGLGLEVTVEVEPSWANIADKLTYGLLDAAVMLPPLALAAAMGLRGPATKLLVPLSLSQGGNTVVLSPEATAAVADGRGIAPWLQSRSQRPRFGVVHVFSTHNLLLRYWLATAGADPVRDIETVVVPPEGVVTALANGRLDGFCAGAPWGGLAVEMGAGHILLGTSSIWPHHPEKCLAVGQAWVEAHPEGLVLLLRALLRAQTLCDDPAEAPDIAAMLARSDTLCLPEGPSRAALPGGDAMEHIRFQEGARWFPERAHALWFLHQMQRWGWISAEANVAEVALRVYRPDLLGPALTAEGMLLHDIPVLQAAAPAPPG